MKRRLFEAVAPRCPACGTGALRLGVVAEGDADAVRTGAIHCGNPACYKEFPIVDGVPWLVPDPRAFLQVHGPSLLERDDLDPFMTGLLGDGLGPNTTFDATRQHRSSYGWGHWGDLAGLGDSGLAGLFAAAAPFLTGLPDGLVVEIGSAMGRVTAELAAHTHRPVLGIDLHVAMLRASQRLLRDGVARFPFRRSGVVFDGAEVPVPHDLSNVDFWGADGRQLPFQDGQIAGLLLLNVFDTLVAPYEFLGRLPTLLAPGGVCVMAQPYDWSTSATAFDQWIGGHSQRGFEQGDPAATVRALLDGRHPGAIAGLELLGEVDDLPWIVRMHDRAQMHYRCHLVAVRRAG